MLLLSPSLVMTQQWASSVSLAMMDGVAARTLASLRRMPLASTKTATSQCVHASQLALCLAHHEYACLYMFACHHESEQSQPSFRLESDHRFQAVLCVCGPHGHLHLSSLRLRCLADMQEACD